MSSNDSTSAGGERAATRGGSEVDDIAAEILLGQELSLPGFASEGVLEGEDLLGGGGGEPADAGGGGELWFPVPRGGGGVDDVQPVQVETPAWDTTVGLWDSAGIEKERASLPLPLRYDDLADAETPLMQDPPLWEEEEDGEAETARATSTSISREKNDDFFTVDWAFYAQRDRERRYRLGVHHARLPHYERYIRELWEILQSWIALLLIGFFTGAVAATVGVGADFFSEIRMGTCHAHGFWISKSICCKGEGGPGCTNWWPWSRMLLPEGQYEGWEWVVDFGAYTLISVLEACTACWLVLKFAPFAAGSGISEVKVVLGGFVIKRLLGAWVLLVKSLGLMLSVGSGMLAGKEGPFVHIACCIANILSRLFPRYRENEAKKRELMSSAAAAGVAVAFGSPVGGVLFSLEEVSSYFPARTMWKSIFCAIIALITIQRLLPINHNKMVMFEVSFHHQWHLFEVIPFALVGALGGLIGALFIHVNPRICQGRKNSSLGGWPITWVIGTCFLTSVLHYPVELLRGSKIALLQMLFADCRGPAPPPLLCPLASAPGEMMVVLVSAAMLELSLTLLTFGLKIPGGLFIPSLTVGALLGRAVGTSVQAVQAWAGDGGLFEDCARTSVCVNPAIYAIVGAAAVLGGITRMTVSLVVIMIEVTNGMQYVLPLMVAVMVSKWVGDAFGPDSIYLVHIRQNGYPLLESKEDIGLWPEQAIDAIQTRTLQVLTVSGETVGSVLSVLSQSEYNGFPVVTDKDEMLVVGYIPRRVLESVLERAEQRSGRLSTQIPCLFSRSHPPSGLYMDFSSHLDSCPGLVFHSTPLASVVEMFRAVGLRYLLATREGQLIGIIKKKDVLELLESRSRSNAQNAGEGEEAEAEPD